MLSPPLDHGFSVISSRKCSRLLLGGAVSPAMSTGAPRGAIIDRFVCRNRFRRSAFPDPERNFFSEVLMPRQSGKGLLWLRFLVNLAIAVFLFVIFLQFNQFEGRIERLTDAVSGLGKEVARLRNKIEAGPPASSRPREEEKKTREAASVSEPGNFLTPDPFVLVPPEADRNGEITYNLVSPPKGFNVLTENSADVSEIYEYVTDSLARRHWENPDRWAPALAERIEISDDYKVYTIRLRPGVKWHRPAVDWSDPKCEWLKGDHFVTAEDVKFAFDLIMNPQVEAASLRNYYQDVESVEVVDELTVVFRWKKKVYHSLTFTVGFVPVPKFLYAFDENGKPFPPETLGREFNTHWYNDRPIGCGAFEFAGYETGVSLKLKRNEEYYGEKPALRAITFLFVRDPNQRLLKLKSGELDYGPLTPSQYRTEILGGRPDSPLKDGRIKHLFYRRLGYVYIGWNLQRVPFREKKVRQAMTYAFNRKGILENVLMGLGTIVTGNFFIDNYAYNHKLKPRPFDLGRAAALLDEAGWKDKDGDGVREKVIGGEKRDFTFDLLVWGSSETFKTVAGIYKEDLKKIGVHMNVQPLDWAIMQKRMEDSDFDAYTGAWALAWDSDPYQIWHSSQADIPKSSNRIGFRNAEADRIIEKARVTFDIKKRAKLFHRFHEIIYEEQPYTFFYCPKVVLAYWNYVRHLKVRPFRLQVNLKSVWVAPH